MVGFTIQLVGYNQLWYQCQFH